jgi:hypothetical protein
MGERFGRCLNCGAERRADACEACGLSSSAAGLALRRQFANRTAIFLTGSLFFVLFSGKYPPLELDAMLIFTGIFFFITLVLGLCLERRAVIGMEVEALKRVYYGLVPLPWLLGILLVGNGALDRSQPVDHATSVVSKFAVRGPVPLRRLVVLSWRQEDGVERLPVDKTDFDRFQPGDAIMVRVQEGLVGIPWVASVYRR